MEYRAAMDLGGTHCRFYLERMDGASLGEFSGTGCTLNLNGYEQTKNIISKTIFEALRHCGLTPDECRGFVCAASGADTPELENEYLKMMCEFGFNRSNVRVYNDCAIFLAHCDKPALLIASGTGSILWACDGHGKLQRYGGWGHLTSDEGSAFSVALKALSSVTRHLDGEGQAPLLTALISEKTGLTNQNAITRFAYDNILNKSEIAALAPLVFQAAEAGDPEADRLIDEAAKALLHGVEILTGKMHGVEIPSGTTIVFSVIYFWGSLLVQSPLLSGRLKKMLAIKYPSAVVKIPDGSALYTAMCLARNLVPNKKNQCEMKT